MSKIDVEYVTQSINGKDKLIAEDIVGFIIPRKGDLINFDSIESNYLEDWQKIKKWKVGEVEIIPPVRVIVRVYQV